MDFIYLSIYVVAVIFISFYVSKVAITSKNMKLEKVIVLIPFSMGLVFVLGIYVYEAITGVGKFASFVYPVMFILTAFISLIGISINIFIKGKNKIQE